MPAPTDFSPGQTVYWLDAKGRTDSGIVSHSDETSVYVRALRTGRPNQTSYPFSPEKLFLTPPPEGK